MKLVYATALKEALLYQKHGLDAIIIENFNDAPFFPDNVPAETIAALTAVTREIVNSVSCPVGVNVLRNDAQAAMAIATVCGAHFIRVNVHSGASVTDQGLVQGKAHLTLRLKKQLNSTVLVFADVAVKHAVPLASRPLADEIHDIAERGMVDAIILSGAGTGKETPLANLEIAKGNTTLPVMIGSGITQTNLLAYLKLAENAIVGSFFKEAGNARNSLDETRLGSFMESFNSLRF